MCIDQMAYIGSVRQALQWVDLADRLVDLIRKRKLPGIPDTLTSAVVSWLFCAVSIVLWAPR